MSSSLLYLLLAAFVVFRFATRELKPRIIRSGFMLWLRPVLVLVLLALASLGALTASRGAAAGELLTALGIGAVCGLIVGALVLRLTTFAPATVPNAIVASGSWLTFGVWILAFVLRLGVRFVVPHGDAPSTVLVLNAGTVSVLAAALLLIAIVFQREIARYAAAAAVSAAS